MRLTMKERKKATAVVAPRYQRAKKKEKGMILNEFIKLTGYNRSYAAHVLQIHGRKVYIGSKTVMVGDVRKKAQRKRQAFYDSAVTEALAEEGLVYHGLYLRQEACPSSQRGCPPAPAV